MRNRRRPRAVDLVLSILVFLGAYISTNPSLTVASPTGFMIGFLLALTYSATLMVPKELYARGSSRNEVIVQSSISATLALTPVVLLLDGVRLVAESLPPIVYGGVICMGVAVILFYEGLKSINPMRAGLITTLEPVTSLILSRAVLGEALQPLQYVGAEIIVIVAMITTLTPHRE
jgi:drug/metabolite transporter (DMT)-like permease